MNGEASLEIQLKEMVIEECGLDIEPAAIADDCDLFSPDSGLDLDSIDALEISMGLRRRFGLRITDPKEFRRLASTIRLMAACVRAGQQK
ncbi:MAG: phosphopantetheine-binding protein [Desulfobulbaceae bacterium]|jgi:acyl carrier protein|nr:phosphopantetheine-binding protein [Desulfobulbaceae bacterium]